jgi:hypothetical protein
MENLLSTKRRVLQTNQQGKSLTAERAIHFGIFILLLIGLSSVSAWVCYTYLGQLILQIAGITLSWGIILLVLYVGFTQLKWDWWTQKSVATSASEETDSQ